MVSLPLLPSAPDFPPAPLSPSKRLPCRYQTPSCDDVGEEHEVAAGGGCKGVGPRVPCRSEWADDGEGVGCDASKEEDLAGP